MPAVSATPGGSDEGQEREGRERRVVRERESNRGSGPPSPAARARPETRTVAVFTRACLRVACPVQTEMEMEIYLTFQDGTRSQKRTRPYDGIVGFGVGGLRYLGIDRR